MEHALFVSSQVYPIVDFPLQDISLASQRGIEEHSAMLASRARILQQVRRGELRIRAWLGDASLLTQMEETGAFTLRSEGAGDQGLGVGTAQEASERRQCGWRGGRADEAGGPISHREGRMGDLSTRNES